MGDHTGDFSRCGADSQLTIAGLQNTGVLHYDVTFAATLECIYCATGAGFQVAEGARWQVMTRMCTRSAIRGSNRTRVVGKLLGRVRSNRQASCFVNLTHGCRTKFWQSDDSCFTANARRHTQSYVADMTVEVNGARSLVISARRMLMNQL